MKTALATIVGESPYSQSRCYTQDVPKLNKETHDAYEERTWRHRLHVNKLGHVEIPGTAFANALKESAKRLKLQVPGMGRLEYTKYFEAGIMVPDCLTLTDTRESAACDRVFVPSDGRPGGGKRVWKNFPRIDSWGGDVLFYVLDDLITAEVFRKVLVTAGQIVGIGRFRPQNRGFYGRFSISSIEWVDQDAAAAE